MSYLSITLLFEKRKKNVIVISFLQTCSSITGDCYADVISMTGF